MFKCDYDINQKDNEPNKKKMSLENSISKERKKGKHASSTENRRLVWEYVIWPLVLDVNRNYFTLKEYHIQRDTICRERNIFPSKVAGGFVSLLVKGILIREKNIYSIHYKLIPYMRKKVNLDYGTVIRVVNTKK
ncbi:MAG TPA: hypothetical protein VEQ18_00940 [Candidatus Nitrosocosmicus sp.]|nr:hypothetical protein [Candidatus Nitrosocosmicus sp.]